MLEASIVSGFERGIAVEANNVILQKNLALGGPLAAVLILHNPATDKSYQPTVVTQNNFTTVNTILYADPADAKSHTLLSAEWMGISIDSKKPTVATRVIGRLLDSNNTSNLVEVSLRQEMANNDFNFIYFKNCNVLTVTNEDKIGIIVGSGNNAVGKEFLPGDKYFDCDLKVNANKVSVEILKTDHLRFTSNAPTVSLMSDDIDLGSLATIPTTLITPGQVISGEGGGLMDAGGSSGGAVSVLGGDGSGVALPPPGGGELLIIDEAQKEESDGNNAMTPGGITLEAAPSAAGASVGSAGCSLIR
jgi:hypothetical protein